MTASERLVPGTEMDAVLVHEFGGPDMLRPGRLPIPSPARDEVLIAAEAVGVGFAQTQMRAATFPAPFWRPRLPFVLGGDVVGRVVAVGHGVRGVEMGERVGTFVLDGGYAQFVVAPGSALVQVPAGLDAAEATSLAGIGSIAVGVLDIGRMVPGESVLVHAAAGGVGHLAVQLARIAGAGQVIATASTPARLAFARSLGADVAIDYSRPDWTERVREATGSRGVDLILNGVGGDILRADVGLLAPLGRLVFYGSADGGKNVPAVPVLELTSLRFVAGFALSPWRAARPEAYREGLAALTGALASERVRCAIHARLPLARAADGHRILEAREQLGRVVLVPG